MENRGAKHESRVKRCPGPWLAGAFLIAVASPTQSLGAEASSGQYTHSEVLTSRVGSNEVSQLLRQLTGEEAILVNGKPAVITTRHTTSGKPLWLAQNFAAERLREAGLEVELHGWSRGGYTNRNLVATQSGTSRSNEFVWFTAHLDVRNGEARVPGADDNASGCAAVLTAARLLAEHRFERSIRYVLFTGEEQGGLGSAAEAERARAAGEAIAGVVNADMIAWDKRGEPVLRIVTRPITSPQFVQDLMLAMVVTNAIHLSGLDHVLVLALTMNGNEASDHAAFWDCNYPAVLVTEDFLRDANPYYHSAKDTLAHVNWDYYLAVVRSLVVAIANLAAPADPPMGG